MGWRAVGPSNHFKPLRVHAAVADAIAATRSTKVLQQYVLTWRRQSLSPWFSRLVIGDHWHLDILHSMSSQKHLFAIYRRTSRYIFYICTWRAYLSNYACWMNMLGTGAPIGCYVSVICTAIRFQVCPRCADSMYSSEAILFKVFKQLCECGIAWVT